MSETSPNQATTDTPPVDPQLRLAEIAAERALLADRRAVQELRVAEMELVAETSAAKMQLWDEHRERAVEQFLYMGQAIVDPVLDSLPRGWGFDSTLMGGAFAREATPSEILDGAYPPAYTSEQDLSRYRALARLVSTVECPGVGILENLRNYIVGPGYSYSIGVKKGTQAPDGLMAAAQAVVDEFLDINDWCGDLESELLTRSACDGEFFLLFNPEHRGATRVTIVEPQMIEDCGEWKEVQQRFDYGTNFRFGILSPNHDPSMMLGASALYPDGTWRYYPASRLEHHKCNVPRNAKRGVSDFFPAWRWLQSQSRLLSNTAEGAAELSAIAYIIAYAENVSQARAQSMRESAATMSYQQRTAFGGQKTIMKEHRPPGSVLNVPRGQEYQAGPAGHERGNAFLEVVQGILRQVGTRWAMPEGFISGDDSNNSYASSLTAGSRFHRYAVCRQQNMAARFQRIIWKALRFAFDAGRFERFGIVSWRHFMRLLELNIECPPVDELGKLDQERIYDMRLRSGAMSMETYRSKIGLDHEQEEQRLSTQTPIEFRQPYMT